MMPSVMQVSAVKGAFPKRDIAPHLANLTLDGAIIIDKPRTEHINVTRVKRLFKHEFVSFEAIDGVAPNSGRRIATSIAMQFGYVDWFSKSGRQRGYRYIG